MLRYRAGRNYLMFESRQGKNLLSFQPYAQTVRFNLRDTKEDVPLIVFSYQSEAFEKFKWFFCHQAHFGGAPKIIFAEAKSNLVRAYLRMEAEHFPVGELQKSFGEDVVPKKQVEEVHVVVSSEVLARILDKDLFTNAFLNSPCGHCELQLRDEVAFHYVADYKSGACISTEAEIICPAYS